MENLATIDHLNDFLGEDIDPQRFLIEFWRSDRSFIKIAGVIQQVMSEVTYLYKDGKNTFQKYNYVSEAQACAVCRESWIKNGLVAIPYVDQFNFVEVAPTKAGANQYMATVGVVYQLIHVESGESILCRFVGQGVDSGDKGIYKALTGANKYFLFKTFQLETTDTPNAPKGNLDAEIPNDAEQPSAAAKYEPQKPPAQKPPVEKKQQEDKFKPYIFVMDTQTTGRCAWCDELYQHGEKIVKSLDNEVGHTGCWKSVYDHKTGKKL